MKELLTALVAAKATFKPIPKDKVNPFHRSKYASLDAVLGAVEESLHRMDLTLSHTVAEGKLITRLYHTSGDYLESSFNLPDLSDPQKLGSIISYYRRYAVCGLLSVTADEDDDGNTATSNVKQKTASVPPPQRPAVTPQPVTYSDNATQYQADLKTAFEILAWAPAKKAEWAKSINPAPFSVWSDADWSNAIQKAYMEIDKLNETITPEVVS
jgi:hypothetical protein